MNWNEIIISLQYCTFIDETNYVTAENQLEYNIAMTYNVMPDTQSRDHQFMQATQVLRKADFLLPKLLFN